MQWVVQHQQKRMSSLACLLYMHWVVQHWHNLQRCISPLVQVSASGGKGQLLIPPEVVDKVLKHKVHGPTGMKGLAGIKNIVEKW